MTFTCYNFELSRNLAGLRTFGANNAETNEDRAVLSATES